MRHILIVAATEFETAYLRNHIKDQQIHYLHIGVGMVNTAYHLGKYLAHNHPDLAINIGIAGSFDRDIALGEVVEIIEDTFSELGAEDNGKFLDMEKMGFPLSQEPLLYNTIVNPNPSPFDIKKVNALTVNTVHGTQESILACQKLWNKQIETMEGAAFFQIMRMENIPFYAFRGISNYVEARNRDNWQIPLALETLGAFLAGNLNIFT